MTELTPKKMGLEFVKKMNSATDKKELFGLLFDNLNPHTELESLNIKELPLSVSIEAFKAIRRMNAHENALLGIMKNFEAKQPVSYDEVLLNKLTYISPSQEDYTHIAMDTYFKKKMGKNFEAFRNDWVKHNPNGNLMLNNSLYKFKQTAHSGIAG